MPTVSRSRPMNKREFLTTTTSVAAAAAGALFSTARPSHAGAHLATHGDDTTPAGMMQDDEPLLGQGAFRYRVLRGWGHLDRSQVPVENCHAITENRAGQIVLLTDDTRNNIVVYTKAGAFVSKREDRFPKAHALEFRDEGSGDELLWITDTGGVISLCAPDGRELRRITPEAVASKYPDLGKYSPTNVAMMPDGDFYVSDGYGSHYIHHFDPEWKLVKTFGGAGEGKEHLRQPHSVYLDTRAGRPELLVCDRANQLLKWFNPAGELLRIVAVPGSQPSNIVPMADNHLAIASLNGMILILDGKDRVVSAVGGEAPVYDGDTLKPLVPYNAVFNHPHDVYADGRGDLYVAQWNSYRSYPVKLQKV